MTTRRNILMASLLLNLLFSQRGLGEGLADSILKANSPDASTAAQPLSKDDSREQQAQDAFKQAALGAAFAGLAGGALMSAGVDQMLLGNFPEGAALISMAGQEFGQMASNNQAADYNNSQKQILNGADPLALPSSAQMALNSPELNKALSDAGVNPNQFKQQLASGELKSASDILTALGKPVDAESLAKAQQFADSKAAGIFSDAQKKMEETGAKTLTADGNASSKNSENSAGETAAPSKGGRELASNEKSDKSAETQETEKSQAAKENHLASTPKDLDKKVASLGLDMNSLLSKMFGSGSLMDSSDQKALLRQELGQMGIQLPVKGVSIFALAHRQYSEFGKSRSRAKRVALR
jgi:hypothetical protein